MFGGVFEALGSAWGRVRDFYTGIFGRAAEEGIGWPTVSEALAEEGLPELPLMLEADFYLHEQQQAIAGQIAGLRSDQLIPGTLHLETERLLPTRYAYEVEITQYDREGNPTVRPYYVGADTRLTQDEILDIADGEVQNSPDEGAIGYEVGGITAAWLSGE